MSTPTVTGFETEKLDKVQGIAFDAFGTTCSGSSMASFLTWHRGLPAGKRRVIRNAWMRGEIGLDELVAIGDTQSAPSASVLEQRLRADFDNVRRHADVADTLDELRRRGYRMVTISNVATPYKEVLAQRLGCWMDSFVLSYEIGALKPDQRMFRTAADILELPPKNILVVGDSQRADINGARSLGMPSVLVDRLGGKTGAINTLEPLLDALAGITS